MTPMQLAAALRDLAFELEAAETPAADAPESSPALLDAPALARTLSVSTSSVYRMVKLGVPIVRIGTSVRFVLADVLEWLKTHSTPANIRITKQSA